MLLDGTAALRRAALAGALFGAAAALKYSNAIFVAGGVAARAGHARPAGRARWLAAYVAGGAVGGRASSPGPWLALMWREFGNPVFPLFNAWFRRPRAASTWSRRFALQDLWRGARLSLPHDRARPPSVRETFAPDLRFAALARARRAALPLAAALRRAPVRCAAATGACSASLRRALVLWLATSANARYGLVVLLLAGVCLARLAERLLPLRGGAHRARACCSLVQIGTAVVAVAAALVPRRAVVPALARL